MKKLLQSFSLLIAVGSLSALSGCTLYFGSHDGSGSGSNNQPPGYTCTGDSQCAAGCYCQNGTCEEGGFCATDADCGEGFHCDTQRSSCVPNPTCGSDAECNPGSYCNAGSCTASCSCTNDQEAVAGGFGWCDESRNTCMPGEDPAGTCNAPVTCATAAPICPDGNVPLVLDGCYTGQCRAIAQCESAPSCADLTHEADCLARSGDCSAVYTGHGCHTPTGVACQSGDSNCVCTSFTFASCEDKGPATREVVDSAGRRVDLNVSYLQQ